MTSSRHTFIRFLLLLLLFPILHVQSFAAKNVRKPFQKRKPKKSSSSSKRSQGYNIRSSGIKTKRKKPPKWEQEGDALFVPQNIDKYNDIVKKFASPQEFLLDKFQNVEAEASKNQAFVAQHEIKKAPSSPFMWGNISAGPVLAPKLKQQFENPTAIQEEAFSTITKSKGNIVIASPTGSGKTLAFILPLLSTIQRDTYGKVLIVTPTLDLANQIQRVVDDIWGMTKSGHSGMYIVKTPDMNDQTFELTMSEIKLTKAPIIAGSPKSLLNFLSFCERRDGELQNLSTIVLDECDRLLQTENVARGAEIDAKSPTLQLVDRLKRLGFSFNVNFPNSLRLICASATVGRTLRRQIMDITDAASIDKSASLVTADDRTGKNEGIRKSSILPSTITHSYVCYDGDDDMINTLACTMKSLPPKKTIVFPGKTGVLTMVEKLNEQGFENVNTLRDEVHWDETADENADADNWEDAPIYVVGEKFGRGLDINDVKYVFLSSPPKSAAAYTHCSGRTGRANESGDAITIVNDMKEAAQLALLADTLGLQFQSMGESDSVHTSEVKEQEQQDYSSLTVPKLKDLLRERGLKVSGNKSELLQRLNENE